MTLLVVIGCGDWGQNSVKTLASMKALGGIVDLPTLDKKLLAQTYHTNLYTLEEVLKNPRIAGCVIATPTPTHFALAEACLKAGKHVLLEKPFTANLQQAQTLMQLAKQKKCLLMVGHLLRYHPGFLTIVRWLKEGRLGKIITIESYRRNLGKIFPHESVHWDMGPHDLSMVLHLMEQQAPQRILAVGQSHFAPPRLDTCTLSLDYGAQQVTVYLSRLYYQKEHKLVIIGEKGAAVFDDTKPWTHKTVFYNNYAEVQGDSFWLHKDANGEAQPLTPAEPLRLELQHFLEAIAEGRQPLTPSEHAIKVIHLLNAADASLQQQQWIKL